jgi:hypothetical protein
VEEQALESSIWVAWNEYPDGSRRRLWCKHCRELGLPWIQGTNCHHVETAKPTRQLTQDEVTAALNTINQTG